MKTLVLFLLCLLTVQAAYPRKNKRGHTYAVREVNQDSGGYQYQPPAAGGDNAQYQEHSNTENQAAGQYQDQSAGQYQGHSSGTMNFQDYSSGGDAMAMHHMEQVMNAGSNADGGGYQYDSPSVQTSTGADQGSKAPVGFEDIQTFAAGASAAIGASGGGHGFDIGPTSGSLSVGGSSGSSGGGSFDFNTILNAGGHSGGSGSSDQFVGVQGEVISEENPPSIFKYKPNFGGKDINNLPHILPPGGKSIHELQEEADAKLRAIVAKAKMNQMEVLDRISKLRTNYGFGTLGYDGFKDTRFQKMGNIDLGTHKAIDLGTSIDYNALKGSDGKLKLPVQNVYHTKTLGIHVPKPYPIKHEVAVPAPYPVPYPIAVPHHKPTAYTPLSHDEIAHFSADDGRHSHFGSFGNNADEGGHSDFGSFGFGGHFGGSTGVHFGGSGGGRLEEKGPNSGSFSIEPSQSISESSTIGGLPYGAGTPNAAQNTDHSEFSMPEHQSVNTYGLPAGSMSGALSSFDSHSAQSPSQDHSVPSNAGHQSISSEAGTVHIPAMNFAEGQHGQERPHAEYGPPHKRFIK